MKFAKLSTLAALIGLVVYIYLPESNEEVSTHQCELCSGIHSNAGSHDEAPGLSQVEIEAFESFDTWLAAGDLNNLETGIRLAQLRQPMMRKLMRTNPDAALRESLSYVEYARLPETIQALVEEPFSETGNLEVRIACGEGHKGTPQYQLRDNIGQKWEVYLPDHERLGLSKSGIPLQGIRMDDIAVVRGKVFQIPSAEEADYIESHWPDQGDSTRSFATGRPIEGPGILAVSGGRIFRFQNQEELNDVEAALREADQLPGLNVGSQYILREVSSDGFPFEQFSQEMQSAAYDSTTGPKTALFILVSFPDLPAQPINPATLEQIIDIEVNNALLEYSYGTTSMDATVYAGPVEVDSNSGDYIGGDADDNGEQDTPKDDDDLYDEAIANYMATLGTQIDPRSLYDTVAVYFTNIGYPWGGLASVGGQRMWIENSQSDELILHEFGHNYGLRHANYWVHNFTNGASTNPVDPGGASEEYGDDFDVMGDGSTSEGHFHMGAKQFLGWIESNEWEDLSSSSDNGTYRIHRFDDGGSSGLQALRIAKSDSNDHYWVGYRKEYNSLANFDRGAYITWEIAGGNTFRNQSWLIDTTPGSNDGKDDAPVTLGRTYADPASEVYITPIAVGGSHPNEYLDIVVNFGPFPGNAAPTGTISGPTSTEARQLVLFSASASDSNGDTLAYSWDMGDGVIKDSTDSITHSWSSGGIYQISLIVSDMKGGSVTLNKEVTVSDSLGTWETRTSGVSSTLYGVAANDTHAVAVGTNNVILRSSDGITWNDVSPSGFNNNDFYDVIWTGTEFLAVGQDYDFDIEPEGWEGIVYSSSDGQTWTKQYETDVAGTKLLGIAYDGSSNYVAVGDNATVISKSGAGNWGFINTSVTSTHVLQDVAYGDGYFVFVGHATTPSFNGDVAVYRSVDGQSWSDVSSNTGLSSWMDFSEIEFVEGAFQAGGFYSQARRSSDAGQNWSTTMSGDRYEIDGFASIDGLIYAVGRNRDNSASDADLISSDGINWTFIDPGSLPNRTEITAFNGSFISVGSSGSIRQSGTISNSEGFESFTETYFPSGGADAEETANPDFDWANNLIEYALGGNPDSGNDEPTQPFMYFDESDYAVFEIVRDSKQQDVAYSVWWSQDLENWTQAGLITVENTPTSLKVRTEQTFDQHEKAFFRLELQR